MNTTELTYLLQNPSQLTKEQTDKLTHLIKEFPYFQSARSLVLKGLKDQQSFRYNQELKTTAAYTVDRSVLFDFITSPNFEKNSNSEVSTTTIRKKTDINVIDAEEVKALTRINMDEAVSMKIEEAENVLDPSLFSSKEKESSNNIIIAKELIERSENNSIVTNISPEKKVEKNIEANKPLDFNKKETHSFAEWLSLTSLQPIERKDDAVKTDPQTENKGIETEKDPQSNQKYKFELIDEFIANNPKIKPADKSAPSRNLATENPIAPDELMTETLARVYLAQKKYKKAIQAYKILILKNPEKSGFFADQIRAIKKIQENK